MGRVSKSSPRVRIQDQMKLLKDRYRAALKDSSMQEAFDAFWPKWSSEMAAMIYSEVLSGPVAVGETDRDGYQSVIVLEGGKYEDDESGGEESAGKEGPPWPVKNHYTQWLGISVFRGLPYAEVHIHRS